MVLLAVLAVISLIAAKKARYVKPEWSILFFMISIIVFLLWLVEYGIFENVDFFVNDELEYYEGGLSFEWSELFKERGLWYAINYLLLKLDVPTGGYALKIINIFFLYLFLITLSEIFSEGLIFKGAIFFLPYLYIVAINNLRDTLILLLLTTSIYYLTREKQAVIPGIGFLLLMLILRPIFAGLAVLIIVVSICSVLIKNILNYRLRLSLLVILLLFLLSLGPIAFSKIDYALAQATMNIESGGVRFKSVMEEGYATGNRPRDLLIAGLRYAFTPTPISLIKRMSTGGSEEWGVVEDIVRAWNQIGYYFLIIYILFRWKTIIYVIKEMTVHQKALLMGLLMYLPIYSMHLYGACHQRLKLPFQLAVLSIAVLVRRRRLKTGKIALKANRNYRYELLRK
jgi:hypothetical protein